MIARPIPLSKVLVIHWVHYADVSFLPNQTSKAPYGALIYLLKSTMDLFLIHPSIIADNLISLTETISSCPSS